MKLSLIDSVLFACRSQLKVYGNLLEDSSIPDGAKEVDDLLVDIEKIRTAIREKKVEL